MSKENKTIELKENELQKVTGGIEEFPEAEDLPLGGKDKKELEKNKPNGKPNNWIIGVK